MNFGKLFDAIKGPLLGVASAFIPGGPAILAAYNAIAPPENQLPATAIGSEIKTAVDMLPPEARGSLMEKQLDVEIAEIKSWEGIQESMSKADIAGNSTRPTIAYMMAWALVIELALVVGVIVVAIYSKDNETLKAIENLWPILVILIGFPMELLRYYFGKRTKEKQSRYSVMSGQDVGGGLAGLIKAFKK